VFICVSYIEEKHKNTMNKEIVLLFIHGALHLLGYDHQIPKEKKLMFSLQNEILKKVYKAHD